MLVTYSLSLVVVALLGAGLGAIGYRAWAARTVTNHRCLPEKWHLRARPLFTSAERAVWHRLESVFFDHHVVVKIPIIRFLLPRSSIVGRISYELLRGVYCSFTLCAPDGTVIGCIDIAGSTGMKAINRDLKKKLFDECGIAYAVLSANQLRTLEALRGSFLGEMALAHPPGDEVATASQMPTSQPANMDPSPPLAAASPQSKAVCTSAQPDTDAIRSEPPQGIDMTAVAAARSSLQSKLDRNRKVRLAKINQLSASMGIVDRSANHNAPASWDDSFIMGEDAENYKAARNEIVRPVGGSFRHLDFTRGGEYV